MERISVVLSGHEQQLAEYRAELADIERELQALAGSDDGGRREQLEARHAQLLAMIAETSEQRAVLKTAGDQFTQRMQESDHVLAELTALNVTANTAKEDELSVAHELIADLDRVRATYAKERDDRLQLETEVRQLTTDKALVAMLDAEDAKESSDALGAIATADGGGPADGTAAPVAAEASEPRNRLQLGLELLTLRRMVEEQRREIGELRGLRALLIECSGSAAAATLAKPPSPPTAPKPTTATTSPSAARRQRSQAAMNVSADPATASDRDIMEVLAQSAHGKSWRGTLRRVYRKQEIFPKNPELLPFSEKIKYFRRIMQASAADPPPPPTTRPKPQRAPQPAPS